MSFFRPQTTSPLSLQKPRSPVCSQPSRRASSRGVGVLPVPRHDARPPDADLSDATGVNVVPVAIPDRDLVPRDRVPAGDEGAGALGARRRPLDAPRCLESVTVDPFDTHGFVGARQRDGERCLGQTEHGAHRVGIEPVRLRRGAESLDGLDVHRLRAVRRDPPTTEVERPGLGGQVARREPVAEVRRGRDGTAVARHRVGPDTRPAEELLGGDEDEIGLEHDRAQQHPDETHVVEEREPGHEDVPVCIDLGHLARGIQVGDEVPVGERDRP